MTEIWTAGRRRAAPAVPPPSSGRSPAVTATWEGSGRNPTQKTTPDRMKATVASRKAPPYGVPNHAWTMRPTQSTSRAPTTDPTVADHTRTPIALPRSDSSANSAAT